MARIAAGARETHGQARRDQILEAALGLWARQGFDGTPVDAIAREAGLAKGTVYLYFPTKESILQAVIDRYSLLPAIEELTERLRDVPPDRTIPLLAAAIWQRLRERAPIVGLLVREISVRPEHARIFVERVLLPANRLFASYLDRFVASGVIRPLDTFVAARALVAMLVMFVLTQEILGGAALRPIADDTIVSTVSDLFLHGCLAGPGDTSRGAG